MPRYRVYLSDVSYFSGKLEGTLRAKRIDYERVPISAEILLKDVLPNTGWMKVPAVRRDDGLWLCDSTPLLRWLDAEHPQRALLPADPYRAFLSALVEDYCDEWQWRPAMYWRWGFADNARYLATQLGRELAHGTPAPAWAMGSYFRRRQQRIFLRGDGVSAANREAIAALYPQALTWLENLLRARRYLLGDRPSLVDIAWFGPMFRHYACDPRPAALMAAQAPRVWAWVTRLWNAGSEDWSDGPLDDFSDPAWDAVFADIGRAYLPYLFDNAAACAAGARTFSGRYGAIEYRGLPAIGYRARCLNTLLGQYAALPAAVQSTVDARLAGFGLVEALRRASPLPAAMPIESALAAPRKFSWTQRLALRLSGTPWDAA
jgi:glutathione S-transferase